MAIEEGLLVESLRTEGSSLASAALASITPRMVNRLGNVAEATVAALDLLTSPEIVDLLSSLQKASATLTPLLDEVARLLPGAGAQELSQRVARAVAAGAQEAQAHPGPIRFGELLRLLRRDPAIGGALRFALGFVRGIWTAAK